MDRAPGLSVRLKLTLSCAGLLMVAGALLLAVVWVFLLRYVPDHEFPRGPGGFGPSSPTRSDLLEAFAPKAAIALVFLLVFALLGGWLLARQMLTPLTRITDATRMAASGSLSHRIRLPGRRDEFRELADAARKDPNRDNGELVDRLHAVNTRAIDLTEALLVLSRADQRSREAHPAPGFHAGRAVSARRQTRAHRSRRGRPRPGDRQEHHPSTRRNPQPHPPSRRRALRHGATTRGATADCLTNRQVAWGSYAAASYGRSGCSPGWESR